MVIVTRIVAVAARLTPGRIWRDGAPHVTVGAEPAHSPDGAACQLREVMIMSHAPAPHGTTVEVPDFCGMQALNAWLAGHEAGVLLTGPDPDSPRPLLHGRIARQNPPPGTQLHRWDPVTVWVRDLPAADR